MSNGRKSLEQWQLDDAARLKALFDEKWKGSQDAFGVAFDLGSQGNVWQYLNGRTPLNLTSLLRFAQGLNCRPEDISPRLSSDLQRLPPSAYVIKDDNGLNDRYDEAILLEGFRCASPDRREDMLDAARKAIAAASPLAKKARRDGIHARESHVRRPTAAHNGSIVVFPDIPHWLGRRS